MLKLGWLDWTKRVILKGAFPTRRRLAKWGAQWQFEQLVGQLTPDDIAIDCGANVGHYTRMLAASGATVYAFEPDPHCYGILCRTLGERPNVHLFNQAVGAETCDTKLYRARDFDTDPDYLSQSSSVYGSNPNVETSSAIAVQQIDLIRFITALPRPVSVLKLDIEGAEVPVIEKLLDTRVIDRVGQVFAETHERKIPELAAPTRALRRRIALEGRGNLNLDWA
ncbi:MAG: FkbM family methyltransferase [Hyphomonadaceae bacterium]|jgi:FkbM family methyltransferase|nr:FkbM family methyltransferase [Hyphomonadaceae bacterium]